jgi:hypothetical protein
MLMALTMMTMVMTIIRLMMEFSAISAQEFDFGSWAPRRRVFAQGAEPAATEARTHRRHGWHKSEGSTMMTTTKTTTMTIRVQCAGEQTPAVPRHLSCRN